MRARPWGGWLALLIAAIMGAGDAVASPTSHYSPSIYPPGVRAQPGAAFSACPNPLGLQRFGAATRRRAEQVALSYGHVSLAADLMHSDRSFWPALRRSWRLADGGQWLASLQVVRASQPGGPAMAWSDVVRYYCGPKLVTESLNVIVTVRRLQRCGDCNGGDELFIDRRGVPLVFMVH